MRVKVDGSIVRVIANGPNVFMELLNVASRHHAVGSAQVSRMPKPGVWEVSLRFRSCLDAAVAYVVLRSFLPGESGAGGVPVRKEKDEFVF